MNINDVKVGGEYEFFFEGNWIKIKIEDRVIYLKDNGEAEKCVFDTILLEDCSCGDEGDELCVEIYKKEEDKIREINKIKADKRGYI